MTITGIVHNEGIFYATTTKGQLLVWNLSKSSLINIAKQMRMSVIKSDLVVEVCREQLISIEIRGADIWMGTQKALYRSRIAAEKEVAAIGVGLDPQEKIKCFKIVNEGLMLIGTSRGNLALFSIEASKIESILSLSLPAQHQDPAHLFQKMEIQTKKQNETEVNSIMVTEGGYFAIVGLSSGKLLSISLDPFKMTEDITSNEPQQTFQPINSIYFNAPDAIFCLHNTYLTEWSIKMSTCLGYYEYSSPKCMLKIRDRILVGGDQKQLLDIEEDKSSLLETSLRSVRAIIQLKGGIFAVGGADGIVEVFGGKMRIVTLFGGV